MILDYSYDIDGGGKFPDADPKRLLTMYDYTVEEIRSLQNVFRMLIESGLRELDISQLDFVNARNCSLTCSISEVDAGIELPADKYAFLCMLTRDTYVNMLDILDHLVRNDSVVNGYNWLYDPSTDDKVDLLISAGGYWKQPTPNIALKRLINFNEKNLFYSSFLLDLYQYHQPDKMWFPGLRNMCDKVETYIYYLLIRRSISSNGN